MDQRDNQVLFALLRSAICGTSLNQTEIEQYSKERLPELIAISKKHDVSHLLALGLNQNNLPVDEEADLEKHILKAVYRQERLNYEYEKLCSTFEDAQIPYVPLKGAILRKYYPEPWMRISCDIDILVHEEDLSRAVDVLVGTLGYQTDHKRNYHDISLYSSNGVHIELHFNIRENMKNIDDLLSEVWSFSKREKDGGFRYNLTNEYFVFHHIAHMSYHFINGGCGIKSFIDLSIIKSKMEYDDSVVRSYCRQCGIEDFYNNVLYVTDIWFGDKPHTTLSKQIEEYILKGGVYGTLENKVIVAQGKQGGRAHYVLSRLFMPYEALKNYYPILEKHKWLFPIMQVRRWLRFVFQKKIKRGIREIKSNQSVSKSQATNMSNFLKQIGL